MNRRTFLAASGVSLLSGLVGCLDALGVGSDRALEMRWSMAGENRIEGVLEDQVIGIGPVEDYDDVDEEQLLFTRRDNVFAAGLKDGKERWRAGRETGPFSWYPGLTLDDAIYSGWADDAGGNGAGDAFAIEADGTKLWTVPTGSVYSPPLVDDGVVYVGGDTGLARAIEADTGRQLWANRLIIRRPVNIIGLDDVLYVRVKDTLYTLDLDTGETIWKFSTGSGPRHIENADESVYVRLSFEGVVEVSEGTEVWRSGLGDEAILGTYSDDRLAIWLPKETLHVFDTVSREEVWHVDNVNRADFSTDTAFITGGSRTLRAHSIDDGSSHWETELDIETDVKTLIAPSVHSGSLEYGTTIYGMLYAITETRLLVFDPSNGELASSMTFDSESLGRIVVDELVFLHTDESVYALEL